MVQLLLIFCISQLYNTPCLFGSMAAQYPLSLPSRCRVVAVLLPLFSRTPTPFIISAQASRPPFIIAVFLRRGAPRLYNTIPQHNIHIPFNF